jgi:hypothetical protein
MNWESLDWEILDRLRADFLSGAAANGPYWHTITDLECYNLTFGERIGWKWDAVLAELLRRQWPAPAAATVLDWGCGSGIAGRRVVDFLGVARVGRLIVHDHSPLAMDFAEHHGRRIFSGLKVERSTASFLQSREPIGVLVLSHVLNELHDVDLPALGALLSRAAVVLWVEPGNHEVSRVLGHWRQKLMGPFQVVAPCPHAAPCGMLAPGNEQHWCHFFAPTPAGIHADSGWVKFGQRAGIDLRSLPYSFLALDRRAPALPPGISRIIGEPRIYKGFAKVFNCADDGVRELTLQKRTAPALFKELRHGAGAGLHRWTRSGDVITAVAPPGT